MAGWKTSVEKGLSETKAKPPKTRRPVFVLAVILLALSIGLGFWLLAFPDDLCANDDLRESVSQNGRLKAVRFRRDCGATTAFSTQVSILPTASNLPNEAGNVFSVAGEPAIIVRWIDDKHLIISGGGAATPFKHLSTFGDIQITYD